MLLLSLIIIICHGLKFHDVMYLDKITVLALSTTAPVSMRIETREPVREYGRLRIVTMVRDERTLLTQTTCTRRIMHIYIQLITAIHSHYLHDDHKTIRLVMWGQILR